MTITSLLPRDVPREVHPHVVASKLGYTIGMGRRGDAAALTSRFFLDYGIDPGEDTTEVFMHDVDQAERADRIFDNEATRAVRACIPAVRDWLADPRTGLVRITGWIPGESVVLDGQRFELTGKACEKCKVNPESYASGGGVRCVNTRECGNWEPCL